MLSVITFIIEEGFHHLDGIQGKFRCYHPTQPVLQAFSASQIHIYLDPLWI